MSRFDKIKEGFAILQTQKETKTMTNAEQTRAVAAKEESVEEEVKRYLNENSNDLLNVEVKGRSIENSGTRVNNSKRLGIYEPSVFNDVKSIGQEIKNGKIVIVNFKNLNEEDSVRVENFLYGMCYFADIEPESIDNGITSFDPQHKASQR